MTTSPKKKDEVKALLFLTTIIAPALLVSLVFAYGFAVWIMQLLSGPPVA